MEDKDKNFIVIVESAVVDEILCEAYFSYISLAVDFMEHYDCLRTTLCDGRTGEVLMQRKFGETVDSIFNI